MRVLFISFFLLVNSLFLKFPSEKLCSSYKQKCVSSVFVYLWAISTCLLV